MIFSQRNAYAVVAGAKTQTRRPVKPDEERCRYQPGMVRAVQPGRTRKAIGRIVITAVDRQRLGEISAEDARAEGFGRTAPLVGFARQWLQLYDKPWREALDLATDEEVLERWRTRYGDTEVWVIRFVVDPTAAPRLLHRQSERGYTSSLRDAVPDEPEAVDALTLARFTRQANQRDEEVRGMRHDEARQQLDAELDEISGRLAWVRYRAITNGIPVKDELRRVILDLGRIRGIAKQEGTAVAPPDVQAAEG